MPFFEWLEHTTYDFDTLGTLTLRCFNYVSHASAGAFIRYVPYVIERLIRRCFASYLVRAIEVEIIDEKISRAT